MQWGAEWLIHLTKDSHGCDSLPLFLYTLTVWRSPPPGLASPLVSVLRRLGVSERGGGHGETEGYAAEPRGQWWRGGQGRAKRRCRPGIENLGKTAPKTRLVLRGVHSAGIQYVLILLP